MTGARVYRCTGVSIALKLNDVTNFCVCNRFSLETDIATVISGMRFAVNSVSCTVERWAWF